MIDEKEHGSKSRRNLLIFSDFACLKKGLPEDISGKYRFLLEQVDTGLSSDVEIVIEAEKSGWRVNGKALGNAAPLYLYTRSRERLLLLLSNEINSLKASGRISIRVGETIKVGNAYTNQIFYHCFSLVDELHAEIVRNEKGYMLISHRENGIYMNGKGVKGYQRLKTGDYIDLYGLHLIILKEFLVGVSFGGVCRIAESKDLPERCSTLPSVQENQLRQIRRNYEQEEVLYQGEVELIMPEKAADLQVQPFLLNIGPTLTMVLPMMLMVWVSSQTKGTAYGGLGGMASGSFYYASLAMGLCTALLALFWGIVGQSYSRYSHRREKREKEREYRSYLENMKERLLFCHQENRRILEKRYPALSALMNEEKEMSPVIWNRYYRQKDFLFIRLGIGRTNFQIKIKCAGDIRGISSDPLLEEAKEMAEQLQVLEQVPTGVDLFVNRQIGILGDCTEVLLQLLMQIAICHCYTEVKLVCFYRKEKTYHRKIAELLKWLPHSWSSNRRVRFLAGDEKEAAEILPVLTRELNKGYEEKTDGIKIPWYVTVVLDEELIAGEAVYQYLTSFHSCYPVSAVFTGSERKELPKSCRYFIYKDEILDLSQEQPVRQSLTLETCSFSKAFMYGRKMTGIRLREHEEDGQLPEQIGFLELYGCGRIEELESHQRWKNARTEERMKAPIGCRADGHCVYLDIHERFHGPHGLVAGTTGSGKSELLQTYLLSMAVSYSPADVNFFMIDYKGGGTGNLLKALPHCAGVISNLSGKQIKRAMSAISSENKRRQRLLGEFQVNHIDAYARLYREGKAAQPMPHLILVVDEFAELKKEEPEFMQEIISLAQVGRSLGVHLILATQKPAGTVDDKIWSNARFRMCLKVQDAQDSMDMLKNKDAAALTAPGQCYLQIGTNEYYELFQSGYCGGTCQEGENTGVRAALLSDTGRRMVRENKEKGKKSLMNALIDYVRQTAEEYHYGRAAQLWMPELPEVITLNELKYREALTTEETLMPEILLGLCDDPDNQRQFVLRYAPVSQGHLVVCGGPATGKTTFLQTLVWQLCWDYAPEQVQCLIVAMGQANATCFQRMPGCLCVLKERENKDIFFYHLKKLTAERKEQLAGVSCEQHNRAGRDILPYFFLVIDGYGAFHKELNEEQEELILKLAAEGITLGIYLILSVAGINEMGGRLFEKIKNTIALEMSDRFQYGDILRQYYIPVLPRENCKGRGLCLAQGTILEFQVPLALNETEEYERISKISEAGREKEVTWKKRGIAMPDKFPLLPHKPEFAAMAEAYQWKSGMLPIGYCMETGEILRLSLKNTRCFLIAGNDRTGRKTLLCCLMEGFIRNGGKAVILDTGRSLEQFRDRKEITYLGNKDEIMAWRGEGNCKTGIFISDLGSFCSMIYQFGEGRDGRVTFWERLAEGKVEEYFLSGVFHTGRDMEASGTGFFREFITWQHGICLGGNLSAQRIFQFDDVSYMRQNRYEPPGIGYLKEGPGSRSKRVLLPMYRWRRE